VAVAVAAPAQADLVQVLNDSVPTMALTNTGTSTTSGIPQMQTNQKFGSQKWTTEFDGVSGSTSFRLRSVTNLSLCLRDKPNTLPNASARLDSCNSPAQEISWKLNSTRQLVNVKTGRALTVLPNSGSFAGVQMQPSSNVLAKRWALRRCLTTAC
jgi:hypothetical protein